MVETVILRYDITEGEMDAYRAAEAVVGFSDFTSISSRASLGEGTTLQTNIRGFSEGSFEVEFALAVGTASTVLSALGKSPEVVILETLIQAIDLYRVLKGKQPLSVENSGASPSVTTIEGDNNNFSVQTINVFFDQGSGEAVSRFVREPLINGAKKLTVNHRELGEISRVEREEAEYFKSSIIPVERTETETVMPLTIDTINFREGSKWRFSHYDFSFWAAISDRRYRERVKRGSARFGRGDVLVARVRTVREERLDGVVETSYIVTEIQSHQVAAEQGALL